MSKTEKSWSIGAKVVSGSAVCVLLGIGLCAAGGGLMSQDHVFVNTTGTLLFLGGLVGLLVGLVVWAIQGIAGGNDRQ
jgi:hypothetical protein